MKKVLVNIPERKYVPTLGMGPHRMVYLRSDLVRPLRAYGLIIQVLKEERRKLHVDVPTERKVETETVVSQPTFETPKTDVPVNNTPEFAGGVNGTEAAVSETVEVPTPAVEEKHEEVSQPVAAPVSEVAPVEHTEEQPQPTVTESVPTPAVETAHTEEHQEEAPVAAQPEATSETPKAESTPEVAHVEEHHEEAPVEHTEEQPQPTVTESVPTPAVEEKHEEVSQPVAAPVSEVAHVEEQPQPTVEEHHEEAPVAAQPEVAAATTEEATPSAEETNEVPDTEVTTEPVAAAGTYSTTTGRTIEISEEEYALLSREGVTKQELKDLLNAKGFRTLYRDTLKDLFAKFGIEY